MFLPKRAEIFVTSRNLTNEQVSNSWEFMEIYHVKRLILVNLPSILLPHWIYAVLLFQFLFCDVPKDTLHPKTVWANHLTIQKATKRPRDVRRFNDRTLPIIFPWPFCNVCLVCWNMPELSAACEIEETRWGGQETSCSGQSRVMFLGVNF